MCTHAAYLVLPPSYLSLYKHATLITSCTTVLRLQVSKNHQKQSFVIKISPDTRQFHDNFNISSDVSYPIFVLSKVNKNRSKKTASVTLPTQYASSSSSMGKRSLQEVNGSKSMLFANSTTPTGISSKPNSAAQEPSFGMYVCIRICCVVILHDLKFILFCHDYLV